MPGEGIMRPVLLLLLSIGAAHAEPSIAERVAHATYVPSPSALPSMPSVEWCAVVDAALTNPNTNQARREEYIAIRADDEVPASNVLAAAKGATADTGALVRPIVQGVGQSVDGSVS